MNQQEFFEDTAKRIMGVLKLDTYDIDKVELDCMEVILAINLRELCQKQRDACATAVGNTFEYDSPDKTRCMEAAYDAQLYLDTLGNKAFKIGDAVVIFPYKMDKRPRCHIKNIRTNLTNTDIEFLVTGVGVDAGCWCTVKDIMHYDEYEKQNCTGCAEY